MGTTFSTNDIRGRADDSLTTEHVWTVGKAFAEWLPENGTVVVAKSQNANTVTVSAVTEGLMLQGRNITDVGNGDQQTVITAIGDTSAAGGVLITHDDLQNIEIITLFDTRGVTITADNGLSEIDVLVDAGNFIPSAIKGELRK